MDTKDYIQIDAATLSSKTPLRVFFNGTNIADDCVSIFCDKEPNEPVLGLARVIVKDYKNNPVFADGRMKTKTIIGFVEWEYAND